MGTSDYSFVFHEDTNMKDQTSKESSFFAMIISEDVSLEHTNFVSRYDSRIRPAAHPSDMKMSEKNIQNDFLQYFGNEGDIIIVGVTLISTQISR